MTTLYILAGTVLYIVCGTIVAGAFCYKQETFRPVDKDYIVADAVGWPLLILAIAILLPMTIVRKWADSIQGAAHWLKYKKSRNK